MNKSDLHRLFTPDEVLSFLEFIKNKNYLGLGKDNSYFFIEHIQEYISNMEDESRRNEILNTCIQDFPKVLGFASAE